MPRLAGTLLILALLPAAGARAEPRPGSAFVDQVSGRAAPDAPARHAPAHDVQVRQVVGEDIVRTLTLDDAGNRSDWLRDSDTARFERLQLGSNNEIRLSQFAPDAYAAVLQMGQDNRVDIVQQGLGASALVRQVGNGNLAVVRQ